MNDPQYDVKKELFTLINECSPIWCFTLYLSCTPSPNMATLDADPYWLMIPVLNVGIWRRVLWNWKTSATYHFLPKLDVISFWRQWSINISLCPSYLIHCSSTSLSETGIKGEVDVTEKAWQYWTLILQASKYMNNLYISLLKFKKYTR